MLAYFYIPRLSNDMKIAVQENHLGGQILYRRLDPSKKRRHFAIFCILIILKSAILDGFLFELTQKKNSKNF